MEGRGLVAAIALLTLAACGQGPGNEPAKPAQVQEPSWTYEIAVDQMRDQKSYFAELKSSNAPELEFPYAGGSPTILQIFKIGGDPHPDNIAPRLILQNGQFDCSSYDSPHACYVTIKIDEAAPEEVRGVTTDCGPHQCLILNSRIDDNGEIHSLIPQLRKAKTLIVEAPLYKFGGYQYRFNVAGLNWAPETDRQ